MLRGGQVILEVLRLAQTNRAFGEALRLEETRLAALGIRERKNDSDGGLPSIDPNNIDVRTMMSQSILSIQGFPHRILKMEAARQIVIGVIALKRYQLRHGSYPAQL